MEGRQLLALGQQGHQLGADRGRLRLEAGDPGELAVLEDRVVPTREARAMRWRSQSMKRKKTRE